MRTAEQLLRSKFAGGTNLLHMHVRVSDHCNHSCEHCYQVQGQKGELTTSAVRTVIDRAVDNGLLFMTVSGGESTLRPDLLDIIAHARSRHVAVTLYTNAFTMTEELASRLAELHLFHVQVSLYAVSAQIHDAITRVPGSHARTLRGVQALRAHDINVALSMPLMARNADERPAMEALAARLGCGLRINYEMISGEDGSSRRELRVAGEQHVRALADMLPVDFGAAAIARRREGATCTVGRISLAVEPNGEVRPCAQMHVPLGNAVRQPFAEIVASEEVAFLRSLDIQALHGCRDCDLIPGCSRCHGNAAIEAGDALGPYLSACQVAVAQYRGMHAGAIEIERLPTEPQRPAELGPFRIVGAARIQQIEDVRTPADEAAAKRFPWLRPAAGYDREMLGAPKGELVQLRRLNR